jgi:hypothetical protein
MNGNLICRLIALALGCALYGNSSANFAGATLIAPGDIVVDAENGGKVYAVKPLSGAATLIASGGLLYNPNHIVFDSQGRILTAERGGNGSTTSGIVRLDPTTGNESLVAALTAPVALAFDQSGALVVGNGAKQLVSVNPQNGSQTLLKSLAGITSLQDVDVDQQGRIVVLDFGSYNVGGGKVVRFDPATGIQTTVATGLFNPSDLLILSSGDYLVTNRLANETTQIVDINSTSGARTVDLTVPSEGWIALQDPNTILYADFYDSLSVLRANLSTGQTQTVTSFHFSGNLVGVAIYTPVPEPSTLSLVAIAAALLQLYSVGAFSGRRIREPGPPYS